MWERLPFGVQRLCHCIHSEGMFQISDFLCHFPSHFINHFQIVKAFLVSGCQRTLLPPLRPQSINIQWRRSTASSTLAPMEVSALIIWSLITLHNAVLGSISPISKIRFILDFEIWILKFNSSFGFRHLIRLAVFGFRCS
jgi:hypothetical protein